MNSHSRAWTYYLCYTVLCFWGLIWFVIEGILNTVHVGSERWRMVLYRQVMDQTARNTKTEWATMQSCMLHYGLSKTGGCFFFCFVFVFFFVFFVLCSASDSVHHHFTPTSIVTSTSKVKQWSCIYIPKYKQFFIGSTWNIDTVLLNSAGISITALARCMYSLLVVKLIFPHLYRGHPQCI